MRIEDFDIVELVLLGVLLVAFLMQLYIYVRYMAAPARRLRKERKQSAANDPSPVTEGVSVILCAHNESYNLSRYLQALVTQDYPEYEVIVVDDGSEDDTRAVVESYMVRDPRLHLTFVPYGARVQSTKKLALTLGAKAAQYEYLLLTDADCVPESRQWIRHMMDGFKQQGGKDIVLGFGAYFMEKGHLNRLVQYDTLFNGLHYLGAALCGHPYMGVGRNLAYRKSLFFQSGGFSHMMTQKAGDDDLFVNHVATKANTAVVLRPESYTWSPAKKTIKEWLQQKRRHLSVSPSYRPVTKFRLVMEPLSRGLFYAAVLALLLYELPLIQPDALFDTYRLPVLLAAVGLFILRWIVQTAVINTSARRMGLHRFSMFSMLWFDIILPLVSLWMLIVPKRQMKW